MVKHHDWLMDERDCLEICNKEYDMFNTRDADVHAIFNHIFLWNCDPKCLRDQWGSRFTLKRNKDWRRYHSKQNISAYSNVEQTRRAAVRVRIVAAASHLGIALTPTAATTQLHADALGSAASIAGPLMMNIFTLPSVQALPAASVPGAAAPGPIPTATFTAAVSLRRSSRPTSGTHAQPPPVSAAMLGSFTPNGSSLRRSSRFTADGPADTTTRVVATPSAASAANDTPAQTVQLQAQNETASKKRKFDATDAAVGNSDLIPSTKRVRKETTSDPRLTKTDVPTLQLLFGQQHARRLSVSLNRFTMSRRNTGHETTRPSLSSISSPIGSGSTSDDADDEDQYSFSSYLSPKRYSVHLKIPPAPTARIEQKLPSKMNMIHSNRLRLVTANDGRLRMACTVPFTIAFVRYESPVYKYGGVVTQAWFSSRIETEEGVEEIWRTEAVMVCDMDFCTACNRDTALSFPVQTKGPSPTMGLAFVHTGRDCAEDEDGELVYAPADYESMPQAEDENGEKKGFKKGGDVKKDMPLNVERGMVRFGQHGVQECMVCDQFDCDVCRAWEEKTLPLM